MPNSDAPRCSQVPPCRYVPRDHCCSYHKEILDRANVGRSTFYTHFRDNDALLVSGIHDMIRAGRAATQSPPASWRDEIFWLSLPVFSHVEQHRRNSEGRMGARGRAII